MQKLKRAHWGLLVLLSLIAGLTFFMTREPQYDKVGSFDSAGLQVSKESTAHLTNIVARTPSSPASAHPSGQEGDGSRGKSTTAPRVLVTPLSEIFETALLSKRPEQRSLAYWLWSSCVNTEGLQALLLTGPANDELRVKTGNASGREVKKAFEALEHYCKTGSTEAFWAGFKRLENPRLNRVVRDISAKSQRPQEYLQAAMTVLSSPGQYPFELSEWLDMNIREAVGQEFELNSEQLGLAKDTVFKKFVSDEGIINFRALKQCVHDQRCEQGKVHPEQDLLLAARVADVIERRIREQRWDLLLKQHQ